MTSAEAKDIALESGEPHRSRDYQTIAVEGEGGSMTKLRLVRVIGLAERSHETHVSYSEGCDPLIYRQQCARAWKWLADEHRKSRLETGI